MRWLWLLAIAVAVWWFFFRHGRARKAAAKGVAGASATLQRTARALTILPGGSGKNPTQLGGGGPLMFPARSGCGCKS